MKAIKKAIGYCRVSTEVQDLERQNKQIQEYCDRKGYNLVDTISEKVSGAKQDKASIKKLLDVDNNIADIVVVSELSRISRENEILRVLNSINQLLQNGLNIVFLDEENKVYPAGKSLGMYEIIMLTIKAQASADEREKIKIRFQTGKLSMVIDNPNMYIGGAIPYGYKLVSNQEYEETKKRQIPKQYQVIDELLRTNVELIFNKVIEGITLRDLAKYLNERGIKTQKKATFTANAVSRIIKNSIYYGERVVKGHKLAVKGIVSKEIFDKANYSLIENPLFKNKGNQNENPLKGLLFCPCGKALYMKVWNKENTLNNKSVNNWETENKYGFYDCVGKTRYKGYRNICRNGGIETNLLLESVWRTVLGAVNLSDFIAINNDAIKEKKNNITLLKNKISEVNNEIEVLREEQVNIIELLPRLKDNTLIKKYEKEYKNIDNKIEEKENLSKNVYNEIISIRNDINNLNNVEYIKKDVTEKEKAVIYRNIIKKVIYYSFNTVKGFIVIYFKNGVESIIMVKKTKGNYTAQLPQTFKFNQEKRKVIVPYYGDNKKGFIFDTPTYIEYDFNGLEIAFDMKEFDMNIQTQQMKNKKI